MDSDEDSEEIELCDPIGPTSTAYLDKLHKERQKIRESTKSKEQKRQKLIRDSRS